MSVVSKNRGELAFGTLNALENFKIRDIEVAASATQINRITSMFPGNSYFVDSGHASAADSAGGGDVDAPFATLDYAVGKMTADNGDVVFVMSGHVEDVSSAGLLDLDVKGITVVFLGQGQSRGQIKFTTIASADMDVDAADVTLINPRFVAAIDALTGPIDVNAARFKIVDGTWEDGTGIDTTDALVADLNADDMVIDGFTYYPGDEAGTQKESLIQVAAADRPVLRRVKARGDFGTGIIENGTAWIDALLEDMAIENTNTDPTVAVLLQSTSTGTARNVHARVASGTTYVTADNDMQWFESWGTGTDATAAERIGTALATSEEGKIDLIKTTTDDVDVRLRQIARHIKADVTAGTAWETTSSPVSLFTVTGDVLVRVFGTVQTTVESASNTGTLEVGVSGNTAVLLAQTTADGTNLLAGVAWVDATATTKGKKATDGDWFVIAGGEDIILTVATNNMTAGAVTVYCEYIPLSDGATVVTT